MIDIIMDPNNYPFWIIVVGVIALSIAVLARPFSSYIKFVYPNAKYETIGNPYIQEKNLSSLADTPNIDSFIEKLNSSKDYEIKGVKTKEIQQSLDENFRETLGMMKKDSSKKMNRFFDAYLEKNDFYLIKKELKNKLVNDNVSNKSIDRTIFRDNKKLLSKIMDAEKKDLVDILKNYGFSNEIAEEISKEELDYLALDRTIDKYYLEKLINVKVPYKCDKAKNEFIKRFIDINNIKNVLRAKQMGYEKEKIQKLFLSEGREIAKWKFEELADADSISQALSSLEGTSYYNELKDSIEKYNKEQSVQIFENALDRVYLKHIKNISQNNFGTIGPTIRFLVSKEFEIRNLKVISKGIAENLGSELIKELIIKEASI